MSKLIDGLPRTPVAGVTDVFHGVPVDDPYRWLEDQNSPETRAWLREQSHYCHRYFERLPTRNRIREVVRVLLDRGTCDSFLRMGSRYFFRKRLPGEEQPAIYMRDGLRGSDELLVDPKSRDAGSLLAVKPVSVSPNCGLLLYEVKNGGERTGTFEILNIETGKQMADMLPRGILRGFLFAPDNRSFFYSLEPADAKRPAYRAIFRHVLGTDMREDEEVFCAGEDRRIRLFLIPAENRMGIYVNRYFDVTYTDFSLRSLAPEASVEPVLAGIDYLFEPRFVKDRILALTNYRAENLRIVELIAGTGDSPEFLDRVPQSSCRIRGWTVAEDSLLVWLVKGSRTEIHIYGIDGQKLDEMPIADRETVRLIDNVLPVGDILAETESFTQPRHTFHYSIRERKRTVFSPEEAACDPNEFATSRVCYESTDGISIPMFLVGRRKVLEGGVHPVILTSYGGYGMPMTPQYSAFVTFFLRQDCLFALPSIRGGSEFGTAWHAASRKQKRQTAYDDFLAAAAWLIETGRTCPDKLAIFGGSNSGLLVAAAMTQRPALFRAVLCLVPLTDMLRFHLFDRSFIWKDEFGTADDPLEFKALFAYSPYHNIHPGAEYPATMIVSGDLDTVCNPLHARKMAARLQATKSSRPILLDYDPHRGHSPVLPLTRRIEALSDRIAFFCDQLGIDV